MELEKNMKLFAPTYSESHQYWTTDGVRSPELEPSIRSLNEVEQCFYQGTVIGATGQAMGRVGVHTCDHGFAGLVLLDSTQGENGDAYVIEPAHKHLNRESLHYHTESIRSTLPSSQQRTINPHALHIVYKMRDAHEFRTLSESGHSGCGVDNEEVPTEKSRKATSTSSSEYQPFQAREVTIDSTESHHVSDTHEAYDYFQHHLGVNRMADVHHSSKASGDPINAQRYVELLVANDRLRYVSLGQQTETRSAAIVNVISTLYAQTAFTPATLQVVLIGQVTFFNADPWNITTGGCSAAAATEMCVDTLLSSWNEWRRVRPRTHRHTQRETCNTHSRGTIVAMSHHLFLSISISLSFPF